MRWASHVARMGETWIAYKTLVGNLKGRENSEGLGVDGRIRLELSLGKYGGEVLIGFIWLRIGTIGWFLRTR